MFFVSGQPSVGVERVTVGEDGLVVMESIRLDSHGCLSQMGTDQEGAGAWGVPALGESGFGGRDPLEGLPWVPRRVLRRILADLLLQPHPEAIIYLYLIKLRSGKT